jgi:hypothetical protein
VDAQLFTDRLLDSDLPTLSYSAYHGRYTCPESDPRQGG